MCFPTPQAQPHPLRCAAWVKVQAQDPYALIRLVICVNESDVLTPDVLAAPAAHGLA